MPLKKTIVPGAALQPLDTNQETLREARSQKRKATSPTPQEEELDQEIRDLEAIHQHVQRKREKILRLTDLLKKIDEAAEEMLIGMGVPDLPSGEGNYRFGGDVT
jgi:DNA repair exonuclease SbcCD ATPase subunit